MSKRKLSNQQRERIAKNQRRDLTGSDQGFVPESKLNGLVISHFGQQIDVESTDSETAGQVVRCYQRSNLPPLVTGDRVVWEPGDGHNGIIIAQGTRRSEFRRPVFGGEVKPIAANVDIVLLVIAPIPVSHVSLIDRYLVAIETIGLDALIVFNKSDLLDKRDRRAAATELLAVYRNLGYPVEEVSAIEGKSIESLRDKLSGANAVLVGQSGVGKSSLINNLSDKQLAVTGVISEAHGQGIHTTTTSRLYHFPTFNIIDSPGIREFGLGHVTESELFDGFRELRPLAGSCKYRDCGHSGEAGCALKAAVELGTVDPKRLSSYFEILDSIRNEAH
ncbi:small ribosomal subunit biogenesis GTPase RsgA [Gammaproteobacteria bacterium]|nr:small ribosomal subunit biogenesis GTPase RsgA [Gammaproteobacteria bacterium]